MTLHPEIARRLASLRRGERWWTAEIAVRGLGLALLGLGWRVARLAGRMATTPAPHPAHAADLAVCALLVVLLCAGIVLVLEGPGLLRDVPLPGYFTHDRGPHS